MKYIIRRTEVELRVGKLKNGKAVSKGGVKGEMTTGGGTRWWTGFGGCAIWSLRVVLRQRTGGLLTLFQ